MNDRLIRDKTLYTFGGQHRLASLITSLQKLSYINVAPTAIYFILLYRVAHFDFLMACSRHEITSHQMD